MPIQAVSSARPAAHGGVTFADSAKAEVLKQFRTESTKFGSAAAFWTTAKELKSVPKGSDAEKALKFFEPLPEGDAPAAYALKVGAKSVTVVVATVTNKGKDETLLAVCDSKTGKALAYGIGAGDLAKTKITWRDGTGHIEAWTAWPTFAAAHR